MENCWTSNKPINGLRHFVLVNATKENGNIIYLMVSVLDSEINLKITYEELINSENWSKGWIDLPKFESITVDYVIRKSTQKIEEIDEIFINDESSFNIS
ncbi:TIGR02450 family Trp-rich protein [Prochlorococcus sp. AH-716-I09]|nr:TIGR02450 family Trp-rich protein [Prochlorococcus sp. AH-716-I09]|tara:strand:- start:98 stop:397 length:300 start_codon:yes stop_codon:yes gene_type:complete